MTTPPSSPLFPTRRSSDLRRQQLFGPATAQQEQRSDGHEDGQGPDAGLRGFGDGPVLGHAEDEAAEEGAGEPGEAAEERSEEHTSELQSLTNLVCRLLLEK